MKKYCFLIITISMFFMFCNTAHGQFLRIDKSNPDSARLYLFKYLNMFNDYINTPDQFEVNRVEVLNMFRKKEKRRIVNFITSRDFLRGKISPNKLHTEIPQQYPNGFGMKYSSDSVEYLKSRHGLFSNTYVYKLSMEYSGMRRDGSFLNYKKNQYFYVQAQAGKHKMERISESGYFKRKFKKQIYRKGLFVELGASLAGVTQIPDIGRESSLAYTFENNRFFYDYILEGRQTVDYFNSFGFNLYYMFKPWIGTGLFVSGCNYSASYKYPLANTQHSNSLTLYYGNMVIPTSFDRVSIIQSRGFTQRFDVDSDVWGAFIRLQGGGSLFSFSIDLGGGQQVKPTYTNYIDGQIRYLGFDANGYIDLESNEYGYGVYNYDNEKTYTGKGDSRWFVLGRPNIHIQPSKYFNFRISPELMFFLQGYPNEPWHKWDYRAVYQDIKEDSGLSLDNWHVSLEFAIGIHINEVLARFNIL